MLRAVPPARPVTVSDAAAMRPAAQARLGPPPHKKGPRVFLDYDQAELDAAYDQAVYQPNIQQLRDRWASNSARTRARIGAPMRRPYGPSDIEKLDIFR